jgi:NitT/TauT family transport system substrate-binding protein
MLRERPPRRTRARFGLMLLCLPLVAACAARSALAPTPPTPPVAAATAPGSAAPSASAPAAGATLAPLASRLRVRVGTVNSLGDAPIYIALDRGYFTEAGLDIEDNRFDAATRMIAPLAAGQLDVISPAITAGLFNAFSRDISVRIVADRGILAHGYGYSGLVVRQDLWDSGALRTLEALRGQRVGIAGFQAGSSVGLLLGHALEARGMSLDDLNVVDLPLPDTNAGLANGSLDAAMQIEPLIALGVANGWFHVLQRSDELYPDQQNAFILYAADFAGGQQEAGRRWMVAYLRGVRDYLDAFVKNQGRDAVAASLANNTPVKDRQLYDQMVPTYINPNGHLNLRTLVEAQDWFAAHGYIPQKVDVAALIDNQFVDYALRVLGEYQ